MKLYYKPGACSLASHIILRETNSDFALDQVDTENQTTASGGDFRKTNPKGYVPALELASGDVLSEGAAILQFIADQNPDAQLAPKVGTVERARLQEYLNYVASELHKGFSPLFHRNSTEQERAKAVKDVERNFAYLENLFSDDRAYLLGDKLSVADAYLFVVANWANFQNIDLQTWPNLAAFVDRVFARPATQAAMRAEGLI